MSSWNNWDQGSSMPHWGVPKQKPEETYAYMPSYSTPALPDSMGTSGGYQPFPGGQSTGNQPFPSTNTMAPAGTMGSGSGYQPFPGGQSTGNQPFNGGMPSIDSFLKNEYMKKKRQQQQNSLYNYYMSRFGFRA